MSHTNTQSRLNHLQQSPELVKKLQDFSMAIANSGHIEQGLSHLVDIRASQMNGCAFCLDMHAKEAKLHGERTEGVWTEAVAARSGQGNVDAHQSRRAQDSGVVRRTAARDDAGDVALRDLGQPRNPGAASASE